MKKKIEKLLIVGGSGFIGSNLIIHAKKLSYIVFSISKNKPKKRIKKVNYFFGDLTIDKKLINMIRAHDFSYVVNVAGYIDHSNYFVKGDTVLVNYVKIMNNLITNLSLDKLKRFINIGSSDQYGITKSPQKETSINKPFSPYSLAKFYNSELLKMIYRVHNFPFVELRLFLVYGPNQKLDRLIPQMIKAFLKDKKFKCTGGDQIRDFCYIDDVIKAIFMSFKLNALNGEIINIGSGQKIKVKKVVELTKKIIGKGKPIYVSKSNKLIENKKLYPDLNKQLSLLPKWNPETDLESGLKKTINFYKNDN